MYFPRSSARTHHAGVRACVRTSARFVFVCACVQRTASGNGANLVRARVAPPHRWRARVHARLQHTVKTKTSTSTVAYFYDYCYHHHRHCTPASYMYQRPYTPHTHTHKSSTTTADCTLSCSFSHSLRHAGTKGLNTFKTVPCP